jgi:hypothetical protein
VEECSVPSVCEAAIETPPFPHTHYTDMIW